MPRKHTQIKHHPFQFDTNCSKKRRYATEREAVNTAEYQMLLKPEVRLGTYHCPTCQHWHLTSLKD